MNKIPSIWYAPILALVVVGGGWMLATREPAPQIGNDPVFSREIVAYHYLDVGEGEEPVVAYDYKGEKLPDKIVPDEDVSKRTQNSYTRLVAVENEGTKDEKRTYEGTFYTQPTFIKDGEDWYHLEQATTTEAAFKKTQEDNALASLFWKTAQAALFNPTAGDGYVGRETNAWSTAQNTGSGNVSSYTASAFNVWASGGSYVNDDPPPVFLNDYRIQRGFLPFTTSSIPSGATVLSASMSVYVQTLYYEDVTSTPAYVTVVQTSQASETTLSTADYDNNGDAIDDPTEGIDAGQRKAYSSITEGAYLTFTLNATGRGWVKKSGETSNCGVTTGVTCLGIRTGEDAEDDSIAAGDEEQITNGINIFSSESSGTTHDPYLTVSYTGEASFAFWMFQDF